jgi:glycosyltransferase involved in cell wall biosynthesis
MSTNNSSNITLSIIIPAYNEEDAIANIIERCLKERENIVRNTPVEDVEIIVVSDGSHDKTPEIARQFKEISLISYAKNRGYGAAIKAGFAKATGAIVSFLDADGTCDPNYFVKMCNTLIVEDADIVIGSRMTPESKMPKVRRIGNLLYVALINLLGNTKITDSASGMRVIKKSSLEKIYPLPDGLHFTPAMSCRAVLDEDIKILEIPMRYEERVGESKLGIIQDGIRFLKTIIDIALTYEPFKFFGITGIIFFLIGFAYGIYPLIYYIRFKLVPDYMIYRLITVLVFTVTSFTLFTVGIISDEITDLIHKSKKRERKFKPTLYSILSQKNLIVFGIGVSLSGIIINYKTIWQYISTGLIDVPWVYVVTGAFLVLMGLQAITLGVLRRILSILRFVKGKNNN